MDDATPEQPADPTARFRRIDDAKTLRALAHPTRMRLIELLGTHDTLTATQASELIGESPTNCAFHLRTLAKYGLVTEAERGQGRERPWRRAVTGLDITHDESPASRHASVTLVGLYLDRVFERIRDFTVNQRLYPQEIQDLSMVSDAVWWVTLDEMRELKQEINELLFRYLDRVDDPALRPADAVAFKGFTSIRPVDDPPITEEAN